MTLDLLLQVRTTRETALRAQQRRIREGIDARRARLADIALRMVDNRAAWKAASQQQHVVANSRPLQQLKQTLHRFYQADQSSTAEEQAVKAEIVELRAELLALDARLKDNLRSQEKLSILIEEWNASD